MVEHVTKKIMHLVFVLQECLVASVKLSTQRIAPLIHVSMRATAMVQHLVKCGVTASMEQQGHFVKSLSQHLAHQIHVKMVALVV